MLRYKGLDLLLAAVREINAAKTARALQVTAVGDGECRGELERMAVGIDARFVGFQQNVAAYYQESDIFVNPSRGPEGSPLVVLEALAHSLPCVLSDLPIHKEVTGDGKAAVLFRSGDAADLARCLVRFIRDDCERERCVQGGYGLIQLNHNPENAAKAYLGAFEA
jgi:glycosyltransferase involved in cell wall biosynthesis